MPKAAVDVLIPAAILVALTAVIASTGADIALARFFYVPGVGWAYADRQPWHVLYHYGLYPCYLFATLSTLLFGAGFVISRARPYRKAALFTTLLMLLGPGLLVSAGFKAHWGRPRPEQLQLFGGESRYQQVWKRGDNRAGRSFPSTHASVAFTLIGPYFWLRNSRPRLARLAFALGGAYGTVMGIARMVQGGHFASDILWSGGMIYLLGVALYYLLRMDREPLLEPPERR